MQPTTSASFTSSMSVAITTAPSLANSSALALPMPCAAAVTTARLPSSLPAIAISFVALQSKGAMRGGGRLVKRPGIVAPSDGRTAAPCAVSSGALHHHQQVNAILYALLCQLVPGHLGELLEIPRRRRICRKDTDSGTGR